MTAAAHDQTLCFCDTDECSCPCDDCSGRRCALEFVRQQEALWERLEKANIDVDVMADLLFSRPAIKRQIERLANAAIEKKLRNIYLVAKVD